MTEGDPKKALMRFIAGFSQTPVKGRATAIGNAAPCRSFRSLVILNHFDMIPEKLNRCACKPEVQNVTEEYRPHKDAMKDLVTMAKAAHRRLLLAVEKVKVENKTAGVDASSSSSVATPAAKKQRKDKEADPIEFVMISGTNVPSVSISLGDRFTDFDFKIPQLIRIPPETTGMEGLGAFGSKILTKFTKEANRVSPGRML